MSVDAGNGLAFVCNGSALQVVDVANPASPVLVGSVNTDTAADAAFFGGRYVAVAARCSGVRVVDVANPALPAVIGRLGTCDYGKDAVNICVSGSYAYVAHQGWGLKVADLTDPTHPVEVATLETLGSCSGVAATDSIVVTADKSSTVAVFEVE